MNQNTESDQKPSLTEQIHSKTPTQENTKKYKTLRKNTPDKRIHYLSHKKETKNALKKGGEGGAYIRP